MSETEKAVLIPISDAPAVAGALMAMRDMTQQQIEHEFGKEVAERLAPKVLDPLTRTIKRIEDKENWVDFDPIKVDRKSADIVSLAVDNARKNSQKEDDDGDSPQDE